MSFLLEDETQATLAEALAFIDTFAQDESVTPSSASSSSAASNAPTASDNALYVELRIPKSPEVRSDTVSCDVSSAGHTSGTDSSTSSNAADALSEEQLKKLKARAANTRAVHRYRKRTKTEIVTLREQVEQLDSQLTALRKRTVAVRGPATTSALPVQVSASSLTALTTVVATELRKRQASEALNRRLKEALAKQRKVSAALESVLKKQTLAPELSFVLDMDKLMPAPLAAAAPTDVPVAAAASNDARVYAELYRYLEDTVYAGTPAISALLARSDVDCVFNNTLVKHDTRVGKMFEFLSNTPVAGSREQLTAKLWMFLTFPIGPNEAAEDPFANIRMCYEQSSSARGQVGMKFDCDLGDMNATGVSAFRQFVEPHRTVLTFASLLSVPGTSLLFRESAWIILSDAAAAGCTTAPTLFQTAYRLHAEPSKTLADDASAAAESHATTAASGNLVDTVLTRKGERMRGFLMMIQNRLLNGLRELRLDDFLPKCMRLCPCSA